MKAVLRKKIKPIIKRKTDAALSHNSLELAMSKTSVILIRSSYSHVLLFHKICYKFKICLLSFADKATLIPCFFFVILTSTNISFFRQSAFSPERI